MRVEVQIDRTIRFLARRYQHQQSTSSSLSTQTNHLRSSSWVATSSNTPKTQPTPSNATMNAVSPLPLFQHRSTMNHLILTTPSILRSQVHPHPNQHLPHPPHLLQHATHSLPLHPPHARPDGLLLAALSLRVRPARPLRPRVRLLAADEPRTRSR